MPEYLYPGVYMEEFDTGAKSIEGVSTNTVGIVGRTERGPLYPVLLTSWDDYIAKFGSYLENSYLPNAIEGFFGNGGKRIYVARIVPSGVDYEELQVPASDGNSLLLIKSISPGKSSNRIKVKVSRGSLNPKSQGSLTDDDYNSQKLFFTVEVQYLESDNETTQIFERFENLTTDLNKPSFFKKIVNGTSNLINIFFDGESSKKLPKVHKSELVFTALGNDSPVTFQDYNGKDEITISDPNNSSDAKIFSSGLVGLDNIKDISIYCAPGGADEDSFYDQLQKELVNRCANRKDRFAIIQPTHLATNSSSIANLYPMRDSKYGAEYVPWITIQDPKTQLKKSIPPCGHLAGIYARSDVERGVHKATANEVVRGIHSLSVNLDDSVQDVLNPRGINVIRSFQERGPVVWGARTMSTDPNWKYVNVRRLLIFLEKSIEQAIQWVVFEPNNESLWSRVTTTIKQFLTGVWRTGALMGTNPDEAFFVQCDRSTMTPDDVANGKLVTIIGIAPTKPAEFVIFRLIQTRAGSSLEEIIS